MSRHSIAPRALALLCVLGGVTACAGPSEAHHGAARVSVRAAALDASDVTTVSLRISGDGIAPAIVETLTRAPDGAFSALVEGIPAGDGRRFEATASDAGGVARYAGHVDDVTVVAGDQVVIELLLQQVDPALPFANAVPALTALVASSATVAPGDEVRLRATAEDLDGDALSYAWAADAGMFSVADGPQTVWTAPPRPGTHVIDVFVTDPHGASATADLHVEVVEEVDGGVATVDVRVNTAPEVTGLWADPGRIDVGERALLTLEAVDPDGDPLVVQWSSDCEGSFEHEADAVHFRLGGLPPSGACTIEAAISDGRGGDNGAHLTLPAGPAVNLQHAAIAPADRLLLTEVMPNPATLGDSEGEWFELFNGTGDTLDLRGCTIGDASGATHVVGASVPVVAGAYAVLANADTAAPSIDYVYRGIALNNAAETLTIECPGVGSDSVTWPSSPPGFSTSRDPGGERWCPAAEADVYQGEDHGTPGRPNPPC